MSLAAVADWVLRRDGVLSSTLLEATAFLRTRTGLAVPGNALGASVPLRLFASVPLDLFASAPVRLYLCASYVCASYVCASYRCTDGPFLFGSCAWFCGMLLCYSLSNSVLMLRNPKP
jgi:hypothetical protein